MKVSNVQAVLGTAFALFSGGDASTGHMRMHQSLKRSSRSHGHIHPSRAESSALVKRSTCQFPTDDPNLVAVTPDQKNAGWAMSPDQQCKPGSYCPIACKPGMVMAQWDPDSTYAYPASMNGGLFCDNDGNVKKPFPDKPNCVEGVGSVSAVNKCNGQISFCQTVLPGNEAMLIPTAVDVTAVLAVPNPSYWQSTAAHFYINPPGTSTDGCVWGTESKAIGNWSPYVAGTNTDNNGQTFVKIGLNPVWESSSLASGSPGFGLKIECPDGGCNGLPCQIDASTGKVVSNTGSVGAGNAAFCVVTVPKGKTANIVVYDGSGGSGGDSSPSGKQSSTVQSSTSSQSSSTSVQSSTYPITSSSTQYTSSSTYSSSTDSSSSTRRPLLPGIFHENGTSAISSTVSAPSTSETATTSAPVTVPKKGEAGRQQGNGALAGLVVAFIAAAFLF